MDRQQPPVVATVSNLVPVWDAQVDGGGTYDPGEAVAAVEHAVHDVAIAATATPRTVAAPERVGIGEPAPPRSTFSYDQLGTPAAPPAAKAPPVARVLAAQTVDYDALRRRDIAKELLRSRLVAIAEQREHRSAYEIVFIMLAAAVSVLLAAPPLVQVLLAAHGTQA